MSPTSQPPPNGAEDIEPTPEGQLIRELRERPPRMSGHEASRRSRYFFGDDGISESRWRMIEKGIRYFRGKPYPEPPAPPDTVARMAYVVGGEPEQFAGIRPEVAAELALLVGSTDLTERQRRMLRRKMRDESDE